MMTTQQRKPVIAVDVDEVLMEFVCPLLHFYNHKHNDSILFENFNSYQFWEVWGGTSENASKLVSEFFTTEGFLKQSPLEHSQIVLSRMKEKYDLVVVTSRQHVLRDHTQMFLDTHYPGIFHELKMGNHYGDEGRKQSKPELCKEAGAVLLIDDSIDYVTHVAQHDMKALLFGDYPWNRKEYEHKKHIRRVNTWLQVEEAIEELLRHGTDNLNE
jgi:uncharacterized HAD superfamily protein